MKAKACVVTSTWKDANYLEGYRRENMQTD